MTKKDYIKIASVLAGERACWPECQPVIDETAIRMANMLELDNQRFDRVRFYQACGVTTGEVV